MHDNLGAIDYSESVYTIIYSSLCSKHKVYRVPRYKLGFISGRNSYWSHLHLQTVEIYVDIRNLHCCGYISFDDCHKFNRCNLLWEEVIAETLEERTHNTYTTLQGGNQVKRIIAMFL